jgi:ABC-type multidrug transport system fused ATPase/permease subunit
MLGVVPTLKSELESGVVQEINDAVRPAPTLGPQVKPGELFDIPLDRFNQGTTSSQDGIPERLARLLFRNVTLGWAVIVYLLIAVIVFGIELGSKAIQAFVSKDLFAELRGEGLRRGLLTDPSALPAFNNIAGQYAAAIQQGATNVSNTYGYMLDAGQHIFALVTTIVLVATKSWIFALCALGLALGQVVISVVQARRLATKRNELDRTRNALVGRSDDILSKREILLAYEQEDAYVRKLDTLTNTYAEVDRRLAVSEQKYTGLVQLLSDVGRILILLLALALALVFGQSAIGNIGDAFFLISIYVRIFVPSSNLLMRYDSIKRSEATSKTFLDVIQSAEQKTRGSNTGKDEPQWLENRDINFSQVYFRYSPEDKKDVLHSCTFTVPAGKTTLLLGPSGSGKTTIARLLLKFWRHDQGSIQVGGRQINEYSGREVRAHMSYVSQGDHIVDDTIRDNLSWGFSKTGSISPERMRDVIDVVAIDTSHKAGDILDWLAKDLSIGEQQRLSIARMMLDESEIVIMDEPLAGVDVFTIRDLLPHLTRLLRERNHTVVMISHRLAFAGCADHVVVLNALGEVVEQGAPKDLILSQGVFASLHDAAVAELSLTPDPGH